MTVFSFELRRNFVRRNILSILYFARSKHDLLFVLKNPVFFHVDKYTGIVAML